MNTRHLHLPPRKTGPNAPILFVATAHAIRQANLKAGSARHYLQRKSGRA